MLILFLNVVFSLIYWGDHYIDSESHAIYVSVLELNRGPEETNNLKIKVFTNDLEDAIFNHSKNHINLNEGESTVKNELLSNYFSDHLQIAVNSKDQQFNYLSSEINDLSIWLTFNFTNSEKWRLLKIKADYLMELFPTQSNVVSIEYLEQKRMFRLTKSNTEEIIEFSNNP